MTGAWAEEPWKTREGAFFIKGEDGWGSINDANDWFIAKLEDSLDPEANAERIVSCVNAMASLDPAALPDALTALEEADKLLRELGSGDAIKDSALRTRTASTSQRLQAALKRLRASG